MAIISRNIVLALCVVLFGGCASRPPLLEAQTREEIGRVYVSVSSAAPLGDFLRSLAPDFQLSPADALGLAVPVSQLSLLSAADAIRAGVAINTTTGAAATTPTAAVPVAAGDPALPAVSLGGFPAAQLVGIDPVLRYQAATRLLSEVKMLNRALRNAPFDPEKEQAHLLQLNITVMPHHDAAPYDAYLDLTVAKSSGKIRMIPALLNDSAELTQQQWAKNSARAFNATATSALGAIAGQLGLNYANNQLEEVAGYALNGITSVGRVSDTALRIRLAAQNQGRNGQRFLTARTHNIFVVVISPFDREKPYATKRVTLRSQYEFRRVNGGAIAQPQGAADSGVDISVTLAADDYVSFKTSDKPAPTASSPALQLSAFEPDGTKPSKLAVNLPAWDAHYLGDLRALVKDCNGGIQLAEMSKDDFGKALKVSFLRPTAKSDIPACKTTSSEVTVIVERARLGGFPDVAVVANVILPASKGAANSKGETTSADAEPSAVPKSCAAIAGAFVRAEHLVIDAAGRGALQALVSLKNGKENKYTGATPLIPQYLLVQGADAVSVVPVAGVASPAIKSRTQLTQSTRYAITLQNAVPHRPVIIDFSTLKGEDFVVGHRCSVMPVLLRAPTARHAP